MSHVPDSMSTPDDLTALLDRLEAFHALGKSADAGDVQLEALLARVASLTDALRTAPVTETAQIASRILLADLGLIAAQFRGRANTTAASLDRALDELRTTLDSIDKTR